MLESCAVKVAETVMYDWANIKQQQKQKHLIGCRRLTCGNIRRRIPIFCILIFIIVVVCLLYALKFCGLPAQMMYFGPEPEAPSSMLTQ